MQLSDNQVDLRGEDAPDRTGIRMTVSQGVSHNRLDHNQIAGCETGFEITAGEGLTGETNVLSSNLCLGNNTGMTISEPGLRLRNKGFDRNDTGGITTRYGARNVIVGNTIHGCPSYGLRLHSPIHFVLNNVLSGNGSGIRITSNFPAPEGSLPYDWAPNYESPHEVWVAHNTIYGSDRHAIRAGNGSRMMLLRNIIVGHGPGESAMEFHPGGFIRQADCNLYHNCQPPVLREYEGGKSQLVSDPEFVNPAAGDLHISEDSPARRLCDLDDALSHSYPKNPVGSTCPNIWAPNHSHSRKINFKAISGDGLMDLRIAAVIALIILIAATSDGHDTLPRRDVFVDPGAPAGGDGSRGNPYSSITDMIEKHDAEWGQVFLRPGVYKEDVVVDRTRLWFMPAEQYDVILEGSITVRRPGIIIRGMNIRSEGSGIILGEGAEGCQIQQNRIQSVGENHAGIEIAAEGCSDCLISDNIVDLRGADGANRTGIWMQVGAGVDGNRLDHNQILGCDTGIGFAPMEGIGDETNIATANRLQDNEIGMDIMGPGVTARYNEFRGNTLGVRASTGPVTLIANEFEGNTTAAHLSGEGSRFVNNVIDNSASPAIQVEDGSTTLLHNTVYSSAQDGELLAVGADAGVEARHNIFAKSGAIIDNFGTLDFFRNLYSHEISVDLAGEGAFFGDPQFADPEGGDFHISADSPAAHAAEAVEVQTDAEGIGRPWGQMASVGAHEVEGERESRIIHVAPGVSDGDGTADAPYGSISTATEQARPGDEIVLADGEYNFGQDSIERSGAPDAPIVIRAQHPHQAVIRESRIAVARSQYVQIRDLRFAEPPGGYVSFGPYCRHCAVINTRGIREAEGGGTGMSVSGPGSQYILFEDNLVSLNHGGVGIQISCQRYNWHQTLRDNDISGCYYGTQTGGGSYPTAPPGYHIIEGNTYHDNWKDGVHTKGTDQIICGNHFYGNNGHAISTRYGARNVIVGNYIHNNGNGIRLHSPSHFVVNNVIYNNEGFGIHAASWPGGQETEWPYNFEPSYEPPHEDWIAYNTIYKNGRGQIDANVGSRLMILRNIIVGTGEDRPGIVFAPEAAARQVDGNLYWQAQRPLLREYEGGKFSKVADPLFVDPENGDFRLQEGCPTYDMPTFRDALSFVLSDAPCDIPLGDHIGANLPPVNEGE